jgi:superfamily II DNA or RNA helicase
VLGTRRQYQGRAASKSSRHHSSLMNAPFLTRILRSYQERAATFLYERDAAFLIAPLGAGKGAAALTAIAELIRDGHRRHALVIAPKLVATTVWPAEVAAWPHLAHLRIAVLDGGPEQRRALLAAAGEREVTAIGVDLVPWLVEALAAVPANDPLFDALIIDETSRLKDPSGKRARALLKVAGRFRTRWGLTGTPRPNSSRDLFMPAASSPTARCGTAPLCPGRRGTSGRAIRSGANGWSCQGQKSGSPPTSRPSR